MFLAVVYIFIFIKFLVYLTNVRCKSKVCLVGKTALITGGNSDQMKSYNTSLRRGVKWYRKLAIELVVGSALVNAYILHQSATNDKESITQFREQVIEGIGLQLSKELAARGCAIIIADKADATKTVAKLIKETHNANISWRQVDFTSFKSVRSFAENLKKDVNKLDILVNNAGTGVCTMEMTEDGLQKVMQINYFSHFLLIHLLLDLMLESRPSRIIYTSSSAAYIANLTEDNMKGEEIFNTKPYSLGPYANSKLAGIVMTKLLAEKLRDSGVTSNSYHPGIVRTSIWACCNVNRHVFGYALCFWTYLFGKDPDDGVQTVLHLACSDEVEKVSGKYFMECTSVPPPPVLRNKDYCEKIWALSEEYVKLRPEEKIDAIIERHSNK